MFLRALRSEWLKRRRSFASTLVLGGSLFTPLIVLGVRLVHYRALPRVYAAEAFWQTMWLDCWESMSVFFLPMAAIMATSLVAQIEFKSNAWKQVRTLPVSMAVIFTSKLAVILIMMVQFLILFSLGIYVSGTIPLLVVPGLPDARDSFWSLPLFRENALYLVDCLPIIAAQYLMALRSSNALMPIGVGFLAWVAAMAAVSSKFAVWWPYAYTILHYLNEVPKPRFASAHASHVPALLFFVAFTIAGYVLFVTKRERG
jgi:hypothetical protein